MAPSSQKGEPPANPARFRTIFAYINMVFMGAGAKTWNPIALWAGIIGIALIVPVFCYRHYVQDGGAFPVHMLDNLGMKSSDLTRKKAGILPYLTLLGGVAVMLIANWVFTLPA